jgi:Zn-finger protein
MLQLFFKANKITADEWAEAYQRIVAIATDFPLRLLRIESYNGYQPNIDIDHLELIENEGTEDERLSFYGDWTTFTSGVKIRFYKNWERYKEKELVANATEILEKPLTWYGHYPYKNDGSIVTANGHSTEYGYIDTRGAAYEFAIIAIGIMLENLLPNRFFMTVDEQPVENIENVVAWLEAQFKERFNLPLYYDKRRLLASFVDEYDNKAHAVTRFAHLYDKEYKRNIAFAIENIGYQATFDCYAEILSYNTFGTFGFSDVLDAWIAVVQDLENTLDLIAESKKLTLERGKILKEDDYDLTHTLKGFLNNYILWTPQEREELAHFYTNKEALETGKESLWGSIFRMTGNRIDICPMYATEQELFEAFMYHAPKQGKVFKETIENWLIKNKDAFEKLKSTLINVEKTDLDNDDNEEEEEEHSNFLNKDAILLQYPRHEQPFMELVMHHNPAFFEIEKGIETLIGKVKNMMQDGKKQEHVNDIKSSSKKECIAFMKRRIKKDIQACSHKNFEQWLDNEDDMNIIYHLTFLLSLKIYDKEGQYVRYRILWDNETWRKFVM